MLFWLKSSRLFRSSRNYQYQSVPLDDIPSIPSTEELGLDTYTNTNLQSRIDNVKRTSHQDDCGSTSYSSILVIFCCLLVFICAQLHHALQPKPLSNDQIKLQHMLDIINTTG
eukprot:808016_1